MPFADRYIIDISISVLIYVMLGWGLNIVVGLAGLLDLGYVAFYAVGAYSFALLANNFGLSFWECLPLAGAFAALFGVLLGFPVLRLRGDYLAIVTLGFGEMIRIILLNWQSFTGGPNGVSQIPRPSFFGFPFAAQRAGRDGHVPPALRPRIRRRCTGRIFLYYVILVLALLTNFFIDAHPQAAARPRLGGAARGRDRLPLARHQPDQHQAVGLRDRRHVRRLRRLVLRDAPGLHQPGKLHLPGERHDPRDRRARRPGQPARRRDRRRVPGRWLPEFLRDFAQFRMLVFGAAMVAVMIWRPQGLISHRDPSIVLKPAGAAGR